MWVDTGVVCGLANGMNNGIMMAVQMGLLLLAVGICFMLPGKTKMFAAVAFSLVLWFAPQVVAGLLDVTTGMLIDAGLVP